MKFVTVVYNQETHVGLMDAKCQKVLLLNEVEQERTGIKKIPDSLVECIAMGEELYPAGERINRLGRNKRKGSKLVQTSQ